MRHSRKLSWRAAFYMLRLRRRLHCSWLVAFALTIVMYRLPIVGFIAVGVTLFAWRALRSAHEGRQMLRSPRRNPKH
jgi:hypothetical protein